uniref:Uncharacterized protein n=1 Tax=Alexandrium monilatum TaxID=311494 RepID=A0A7S4STK0_9DINO
MAQEAAGARPSEGLHLYILRGRGFTMEAPEARWQGVVSGDNSGREVQKTSRHSARSSTGRFGGSSNNSRFGGSSSSGGEVSSTVRTGDGRSRSRPPHLIAHTGIDWELYHQAYLPYRSEEHYLRVLRARHAEAPGTESWGSRMWRGMREMGAAARARMPRVALRRSSKVKPFDEHL